MKQKCVHLHNEVCTAHALLQMKQAAARVTVKAAVKAAHKDLHDKLAHTE